MAHLLDQDDVRTEIPATGLTIGRDVSNDLSIELDMRVSRAHAAIRSRDGQWLLVDLDSRNGTFVNGHRVANHPLRNGDRIAVGDRVLRFSSGSDPHATELATSDGEVPITTPLSPRELVVLKSVSDGLSDKEIAASLRISINTVRSHLDRIAEKTGLRKRSELTRLAISMHLDDQ